MHYLVTQQVKVTNSELIIFDMNIGKVNSKSHCQLYYNLNGSFSYLGIIESNNTIVVYLNYSQECLGFVTLIFMP